ncbi:MAG: hypothetical protein H5U07_11040, partial [Candidatus Aminicenantes bacterium]|nr:hypothetical protein [Candidatus Aminicenantes bacterium]
KPGFLEIDLVGHDGGNAQGEFLYSLNATDVATGWVETEALRISGILPTMMKSHHVSPVP